MTSETSWDQHVHDHNYVEACPGDVEIGKTLLKFTNDLDLANAKMLDVMNRFERFLSRYQEWSQEGDELESLYIMQARQMKQRMDFVEKILTPMMKRYYGFYRIFRDETEDSE